MKPTFRDKLALGGAVTAFLITFWYVGYVAFELIAKFYIWLLLVVVVNFSFIEIFWYAGLVLFAIFVFAMGVVAIKNSSKFKWNRETQ